ncbi:MAG: lipid A biosynthesis acyltransferase, partial [Caldiserica bacterium]
FFEKINVNKNMCEEEILQEYLNTLEEKIKRYPSHYFWFHKRWKSTINY